MEKEGLERVLASIEQNGLVVNTLVTDRHIQINKWLRDTKPDILHYYDIWHVAKGKNKANCICDIINNMNTCMC